MNAEESYKNKDTVYVFGHHIKRNRELVWRVSNNKRQKAFSEIKVGDRVLVESSGKIMPIIVTKMQLLPEPPTNDRIKKVIRWNLDKKEVLA